VTSAVYRPNTGMESPVRSGNWKTIGPTTSVTNFESPSQMIIPNIVQLEMALTSDRLILPMMETSGGIWVLENVDR